MVIMWWLTLDCWLSGQFCLAPRYWSQMKWSNFLHPYTAAVLWPSPPPLTETALSWGFSCVISLTFGGEVWYHSVLSSTFFWPWPVLYYDAVTTRCRPKLLLLLESNLAEYKDKSSAFFTKNITGSEESRQWVGFVIIYSNSPCAVICCCQTL